MRVLLDKDDHGVVVVPNYACFDQFSNNLTGSVLERGRFDTLVGLCRERGLHLFSDEVYRLIERDESIRLPQVGDVYERGLSLNVISKAYGLPG
jgi:aspartate/methionine/tyrosine aminotransferase